MHWKPHVKELPTSKHLNIESNNDIYAQRLKWRLWWSILTWSNAPRKQTGRWNHRTHGQNNKKLFTACEESNVNTKNSQTKTFRHPCGIRGGPWACYFRWRFLPTTKCGAIGKPEVNDFNIGLWSDKPLHMPGRGTYCIWEHISHPSNMKIVRPYRFIVDSSQCILNWMDPRFLKWILMLNQLEIRNS